MSLFPHVPVWLCPRVPVSPCPMSPCRHVPILAVQVNNCMIHFLDPLFTYALWTLFLRHLAYNSSQILGVSNAEIPSRSLVLIFMLPQILLDNSLNASVIILIYKYRSFLNGFRQVCDFDRWIAGEGVGLNKMPNTHIFNHKWSFSTANIWTTQWKDIHLPTLLLGWYHNYLQNYMW